MKINLNVELLKSLIKSDFNVKNDFQIQQIQQIPFKLLINKFELKLKNQKDYRNLDFIISSWESMKIQQNKIQILPNFINGVPNYTLEERQLTHRFIYNVPFCYFSFAKHINLEKQRIFQLLILLICIQQLQKYQLILIILRLLVYIWLQN